MDVYNALVAWEEWLKSKGTQTSAWALVPDLGAGASEFDYYFVRSFQNYKDMGTTGQTMFNGGGVQSAAGIMGDLTSCDNARVYDATLVRSGSNMQWG